MTEDILFDNIYVGHSAEDAKKLAAETFEIKKPLEVANDKPAADDEEEEKISFKDDPVSFIRSRVLAFIEAAKANPLEAFKSQPETGAALVFALFTLFGMFGALVNIIGGAQKPVVTKVGLFYFILILELIFCACSPKRLMQLLPMTRQRVRLHRSRLQVRRKKKRTVPSKSASRMVELSY